MSFTRNDWSLSLLSGLGNPNPSQTTLDFVNGWAATETLADSGAKYNLLNTTLAWANTTNFNSAGVKNYASWEDGINATIATLKLSYYAGLLQALSSNLDSELSPPSLEILANLNTWCGGCGYGKNFVELGPQHASDIFEYGSMPTQPLPQSSQVEPNAYQIQAAGDCWSSVLKMSNGGTPPTGTGIYESWLQSLVSGKQYGPPISHEYASVDWNGTAIVVQEFAHARCEWKDSQARWFSSGGQV